MRKILLLQALWVLLFMPYYCYGFSGRGEDCSKCHTLKKEEAAALLKDVIQNVNVLEIRTVPVKSVWEVDVAYGDKKGLVYMDFSKRYIFSGSIIDLKEKADLTKDRLSEINRVDVSKIPVGDALVMGSREAKHKIIVFDDPD